MKGFDLYANKKNVFFAALGVAVILIASAWGWYFLTPVPTDGMEDNYFNIALAISGLAGTMLFGVILLLRTIQPTFAYFRERWPWVALKFLENHTADIQKATQGMRSVLKSQGRGFFDYAQQNQGFPAKDDVSLSAAPQPDSSITTSNTSSLEVAKNWLASSQVWLLPTILICMFVAYVLFNAPDAWMKWWPLIGPFITFNNVVIAALGIMALLWLRSIGHLKVGLLLASAVIVGWNLRTNGVLASPTTAAATETQASTISTSMEPVLIEADAPGYTSVEVVREEQTRQGIGEVEDIIRKENFTVLAFQKQLEKIPAGQKTILTWETFLHGDSNGGVGIEKACGVISDWYNRGFVSPTGWVDGSFSYRVNLAGLSSNNTSLLIQEGEQLDKACEDLQQMTRILASLQSSKDPKWEEKWGEALTWQTSFNNRTAFVGLLADQLGSTLKLNKLEGFVERLKEYAQPGEVTQTPQPTPVDVRKSLEQAAQNLAEQATAAPTAIPTTTPVPIEVHQPQVYNPEQDSRDSIVAPAGMVFPTTAPEVVSAHGEDLVAAPTQTPCSEVSSGMGNFIGEYSSTWQAFVGWGKSQDTNATEYQDTWYEWRPCSDGTFIIRAVIVVSGTTTGGYWAHFSASSIPPIGAYVTFTCTDYKAESKSCDQIGLYV